MTNTIAFNTGRTYTEYGQRIAARQLATGHIVMMDIDRGIDYLLPAQIELNKQNVMSAYDNNLHVYPSDIGLSYEDYYAVLKELSSTAELIPTLFKTI
jgi:hypothetical protein